MLYQNSQNENDANGKSVSEGHDAASNRKKMKLMPTETKRD